MVRLDSTTGVALGHIPSNIPLHPCPLESLLQVLVHLISSWMNRVSGAMGFVHYLTMEIKVFQNYQAVLEP
jgi:hypothetical protein